jgi:hypothetical protein
MMTPDHLQIITLWQKESPLMTSDISFKWNDQPITDFSDWRFEAVGPSKQILFKHPNLPKAVPLTIRTNLKQALDANTTRCYLHDDYLKDKYLGLLAEKEIYKIMIANMSKDERSEQTELLKDFSHTLEIFHTRATKYYGDRIITQIHDAVQPVVK